MKMAFSIIEFLTQVSIGLFVGSLIAIPLVLLLWKRKIKKIRKTIPKDMRDQINIFRTNERRVEDERKEREQARKDRRNQRAADAIKSNNRNTIENVAGRKGFGELRNIPKTNVDFTKRTKPNTKGNWPSFE